MLPRALRRTARPFVGQAHRPSGSPLRPHVAVDRCDPATRDRLQRLANATGSFVVALPADAACERPLVVVVTLGPDSEDGELIVRLRHEHREDPSRQMVVIGQGTTWFDAAFRAGVDAWVDHTDDDATVLAAIIGSPRHPNTSSRKASTTAQTTNPST